MGRKDHILNCVARADAEQPILRSLQFSGDGQEPAFLPPFFLDADLWMGSSEVGVIDVAIVPKVGRLGCWFGLSLALALARRGFQKRFNEHSLHSFAKGELVALLPSREVYRFAGIYNQYKLIRLSLIDDPGNGSITLPLRELYRLQRTERKMPRGSGNTALGDLGDHAVDRILEIESGGNADFFDTEVVYLGSRTRFQTVMSNVEVVRKVGEEVYSFATSEVLPWGRVGTDGQVIAEGDETGMARPLVARASSASSILEMLKSGDRDCRRIVVDNVHVLQREMPTLCRLADDHGCSLLSICGFKDFRELRELETSGRIRCRQIRPDRIWEKGDAGIFSQVAASARRAIDFEWIDVFGIRDSDVDGCAAALETAADELRASDSSSDDSRIIGQAFNLLRQAVNRRMDGVDQQGLHTQLERMASEFNRVSAYWPESARRTFRSVKDGLEQVLASGEHLVGKKREAVESLLGRKLTEEEAAIDDVISVAAGDETLVLSGWPRRARVQDLVFEYDHDCVIAVAFEFEERWFRQFNRAYRDAELFAAEEDVPYRSSRGQAAARRHWEARPGDGSGPDELTRTEVRRMLREGRPMADDRGELIEAQLVWFADGRVSGGTEGHKFPVVRNLGQYRGQDRATIALSRVDELEEGDLCVFRLGSDSDIVREVARQAGGAEMYDKTRLLAESWRYALHRYLNESGKWIPDLQLHLASHGVSRTNITLRNWLFGPSTIGPASNQDLSSIAEAISDKSLKTNQSAVWTAIETIRSVHQAAGSSLSRLLQKELLGHLDGRESVTGHYSLSLGEVELVEVDEVDTGKVCVSIELSNRLLLPERLGG